MQRLFSSHHFPPDMHGGIIALGNFDGFHLGHQAVVGRTVDIARARGVPAIVATFDPHPVRHFRPDTPPFRLTTLDQRQRLFEAAGADGMLVLEFGAAMASMDAESFVSGLIVDRAAASGIVTGADFVFGRGRGGNAGLLDAMSASHGFSYDRIAPVMDSDEPVSSSRIRAALQSGDCTTAARLLTRPFAIEGIVQHGDKVGRTLGFPTANLNLASYLRPRFGIYAVTGRLADGQCLKGAANIGIRPSFDPPRELLEPHFFDFDGNLYGQLVEVALHAFLRPEARFDDMEALKLQMARDCETARSALSALSI